MLGWGGMKWNPVDGLCQRPGLWAPSPHERSTGNAFLPARWRDHTSHKANPKVPHGEMARNFQRLVDFHNLAHVLCNHMQVPPGVGEGRSRFVPKTCFRRRCLPTGK